MTDLESDEYDWRWHLSCINMIVGALAKYDWRQRLHGSDSDHHVECIYEPFVFSHSVATSSSKYNCCSLQPVQLGLWAAVDM